MSGIYTARQKEGGRSVASNDSDSKGRNITSSNGEKVHACLSSFFQNDWSYAISTKSR
jgi:hypothetical protein